MKNIIIGVFSLVGLVLLSCNSGNNPKKIEMEENQEATAYIVIAEEVLQANSYTYVKVNDGENSFWIAVNKMDAQEGENYFYTEALLMKDFESKDLERTFDSIYFVQELGSYSEKSEQKIPEEDVRMERPKVEQKKISVDVAEGGITIAELYGNRESYGGKTVKIKGEVVKYNPDIMGINWVHIQDGTDDNGYFDLTVTTHDKVKLGDVVTFEGKIALEKDFGAGYKYEVIMENAFQPDLEY